MDIMLVAIPQRLFAYTSAWEYECCGAGVRTDDVIETDIWPYDPSDLPSIDHERVGWYASHHGVDAAGHEAYRIRGRVLGMWEVRGHDDFDPETGWHRPVPGSRQAYWVDELSVSQHPDAELAPHDFAPHDPTTEYGWYAYHSNGDGVDTANQPGAVLGYVLELVPESSARAEPDATD